MASSSRVSEWMSSASDWLDGQEWFQQLRGKWEELDPQSRTYLKFATSGILVAFFLLLVLTWVFRVNGLKRELSEKMDLLTVLQAANEEMRRLKETSSSGGNRADANASGPWSAYIDQIAAGQGIDHTAYTVSPEKPGSSTDQVKESLIDVSLKHVSIKQAVRLAYALETGSRPMKLRNLQIDTHADPQGYLDATLAMSGFTLVNKENK